MSEIMARFKGEIASQIVRNKLISLEICRLTGSNSRHNQLFRKRLLS